VNHYFSPGAGDWTSREITVQLGGRQLTVETAAGMFSPEHVDTGTKVLLANTPELPETGNVLDIGCGWGAITLDMALTAPGANVWGVDINERALELAARNAARAGVNNITISTPDSVPADIRFDAIWSNPPIRVGKAELHKILETWLPRLVVGGEAWLVVAKQLGGDTLQKWIAERWPESHIERVETDKGFRVLRFTYTG
jgi:16S rRNA G1207 methylase RsmC